MNESERDLAVLRYVAYAALIALVVVMAYGLYYFPGAPIRDIDGQYVDKFGQIHSREDFEHLRAWELIFVLSWIISVASGVAYRFAKRRGSTSSAQQRDT